MKIYLAADKNFLAYGWGKTIIRCLSKYEKKYSVRIYEFNPDSPPDNGVLFVVGVDILWLESIAEKIKNTDIVVVQVCGELDIFSNSVIQTGCDIKSVVENTILHFRDNNRTRTAFFGIQKNDSSDLYKGEIFKKYYNDEDIYIKNERISDTFDIFFENMHRYDSVICANDLIAIYLLKRLRKLNVAVPKQLQLAGIGNLWISSHISPTLTTSEYDNNMAIDIIFKLIHTEKLYNNLSKLSLMLKTDIVARETTGCYTCNNEGTHLYMPYKENGIADVSDEEIRIIKNVDSAFFSLSVTDREIIKELCKGETYNEIAEAVCLTQDSVKYHLKKIYSTFGLHSAKELKRLLEENLINTVLL